MTRTPAPMDLPAPGDAQRWVRERADARLAGARSIADRIRTGGVTDPVQMLRAWDDLGLALGDVASVGSLLSNVHPDEQVREAAEGTEQDVQRLMTELSLDGDLYQAFDRIDAAALVDPLAVRLLEHTMRDFRRAGVAADEGTRARVSEIRSRLTELDQVFSRQIRDGRRTLRLSPEQLVGLPEDWLAEHPAGDDGLVEVTTEYPDALPVRMYAADPDARAAMAHAFLNVGWPENHDVLVEMFDLRHELATLLGYEDWPSYDAEVKMIGDGPEIGAFIDRITDAATAPMERDLAALTERFRADHPDADTLSAADAMYYTEKLRSERFGVDSQQVRRYFSFDAVREGLLDITGRLFGLRYEPIADAHTWHEDVTTYDVYSTDGPTEGELLGRIHLDLHPREGKYNHAAQFTLSDGVAGVRLPEGVLVCNFSRTLMEHDHVVTLFHEFGHLIHHVLGGQGAWARFAGVATEWDFVEAPSQLLEEWAWDADVLATFATDASGEPIPADLVAAMRRGEEFGKGIFARTQMFYAAMSYRFHAERPRDLTAATQELQARYAVYPYLEDTHFFANFGHLGGYTSGYYTYMWSLVIAKDLFTAFDGDLLGDARIEAARRYRDAILAPGGAKDAADLVQDFLGRPFTFDAYAAWLERAPE